MSENCGAATFSTDDCHVWGSCGWALPGTEVKIFSVGESINDTAEVAPAKDIFNATEEEQGELCFRGRHIMMGYLANPDLGEEHVEAIKKKNAGAIDDNGWLHSGDKGSVATCRPSPLPHAPPCDRPRTRGVAQNPDPAGTLGRWWLWRRR